MRVSILFGLVVCLTSMVRAEPDYANIFKAEGTPCKTSNDCTYKEFHCRTEKSGCQPFLGTLRSPCGTDDECQFGLSCRQDMLVKPEDFKKYIESGASGPIKISKFQHCFFSMDPELRRVNPNVHFEDDGGKTCEEDSKCPHFNCIYGVCLAKPGVAGGRCANDDWCLEGFRCVQGPHHQYCMKVEPEVTFKPSDCTEIGLSCWSDSSCCSGNCVHGPILGLSMQCERK